jgi:hypothetical protein
MRIYEQDVVVAVIPRKPSLFKIVDVIQKIVPERIVTGRIKEQDLSG